MDDKQADGWITEGWTGEKEETGNEKVLICIVPPLAPPHPAGAVDTQCPSGRCIVAVAAFIPCKGCDKFICGSKGGRRGGRRGGGRGWWLQDPSAIKSNSQQIKFREPITVRWAGLMDAIRVLWRGVTAAGEGQNVFISALEKHKVCVCACT